MKRRDFIKYTLMGLMASSVMNTPLISLAKQDEDEAIFEEKIKFAEKNNLSKKPINEIMIEIGKSFTGTPYVGNTLDSSGKEALVTNLHGLDCWTFFENTLVISRLIRDGKKTFNDYKKELEFIRYRGGIRTDYTSRIHYFIDWLYDNTKKGVVKDVNKEIGGVKLDKKINFMTVNRLLYPPLKSDEFVKVLRKIEEDISSRDYYYIPTNLLPKIESKLNNGDIVGIMTSREGLDTGHTGLIYKDEKVVRIMDASSLIGKVSISDETLYEYLTTAKKPGIIIARPI